MDIKWYGQSCFEVKSKDTTLIFDPFSDDIGLKPLKLKSDVLLISHDHHDHNNKEAVSGIRSKKPVIFKDPGEYEASGIYIEGIQSYHDEKKGAEKGLNTIFIADIEDIKVCHLGDLGHVLENGELEKIGDVDVLMVPVGGTYTIDAEKAMKVINEIDPAIVIPMHYEIPKLNINLASLDDFLDISEAKGIESQGVLKLKKADLPKDDRKIVVLNPQKS